MSDYISREAAIERLSRLMKLQAPTARAIIEAIPAADVRPVVRGKWEEDEVGEEGWQYYRCTRCGAVGIAHFHFCPHCGARMEES